MTAAGTGFTTCQNTVVANNPVGSWTEFRVQSAAGPVAATWSTNASISYSLAVMLAMTNPGASAAYQIDYTFEDPNDLISPVPLASLTWDNTLIPAVAKAAVTSTTFTIQTAPVWARVQCLGGATSVRVVFTQYDEQHMIGARVPPS